MNRFKDIKKIFTLAMASSMFLTSAQVVFAADATITITEAQGTEYQAFKIMDLITDGEHYSYNVNPKYRALVIETINELTPGTIVETSTEKEIDLTIISYLEKVTDARVFADKMYTKIKADTTINADKTVVNIAGESPVFDSVNQGYYLIAETGIIAAGTDRSLVMLDTLGMENLEVSEKRGVPTLDKVIVENGTDTEYVDAGLNDVVTYKLTGTMPENISAYEKYKYIMHDKLPNGLTFKQLKSIIIGETEITNVNAYLVENPEDCSVEIKFDDIKSLGINIDAETKVVVQYEAIVNTDAIIGKQGNQNKAHLEFSNDPYDSGSTEHTPEDDAKVYSFSVVVNKVDKDSNPLSGAEFKLQKKNGEDWIDLENGITVEYKKNEEGTVFTFETLDVGTYKLVETQIPTGYNKADDIIFEIVSSYESNELKSLIIKNSDGTIIGKTDLTDDNAIFSIDSNQGTATTEVINTTGIKLPSTGSTGAIMIYCASGIALIIGITSFVTAKKRKKDTE